MVVEACTSTAHTTLYGLTGAGLYDFNGLPVKKTPLFIYTVLSSTTYKIPRALYTIAWKLSKSRIPHKKVITLHRCTLKSILQK